MWMDCFYVLFNKIPCTTLNIAPEKAEIPTWPCGGRAGTIHDSRLDLYENGWAKHWKCVLRMTSRYWQQLTTTASFIHAVNITETFSLITRISQGYANSTKTDAELRNMFLWKPACVRSVLGRGAGGLKIQPPNYWTTIHLPNSELRLRSFDLTFLQRGRGVKGVALFDPG